jgi:hypothetical protein
LVSSGPTGMSFAFCKIRKDKCQVHTSLHLTDKMLFAYLKVLCNFKGNYQSTLAENSSYFCTESIHTCNSCTIIHIQICFWAFLW